MLGLPALSVVSVWSGRCLIYGDGITVNRLLPSWEWVSSPSPGTGISHLDKIALKLHCSEYLNSMSACSLYFSCPRLHQMFSRYSCPILENCEQKETFLRGRLPSQSGRVRWWGGGLWDKSLGQGTPLHSWAHGRLPAQSRRRTGAVSIQPWMRGRDSQVQTPFTSTSS